jgi:transcriptional regulator with XRE-family HTH domain
MRRKPDADDLEFRSLLTRRMKELRVQQKRSLIDAAVDADINPNYYARIERGKSGNPRISTILKIKRGLEVSWAEFLGEDHILVHFLKDLE